MLKKSFDLKKLDDSRKLIPAEDLKRAINEN